MSKGPIIVPSAPPYGCSVYLIQHEQYTKAYLGILKEGQGDTLLGLLKMQASN